MEKIFHTWQLWIASLKKSSRRRLSRLGFLSNAALMLPRNLGKIF